MKKNYTYLGTTKANHMTIISLGMQFGLQHIRKMSIGEAIALRANEGDEKKSNNKQKNIIMTFDELYEHKGFKEIQGAFVNNLGYATEDDIISDGYHSDHTSIGRGYQSRYYAIACAYKGKFGEGVKVVRNNPRSTYFGKLITYYVK